MGYYVIDIVVKITVVSIIKERTNYENIRALKGMAARTNKWLFIQNTNFASKIKRLME